MLGLIITVVFFGFDDLISNASIDLNIHDTYFVMEGLSFLLMLITLLFFWIYLIRMLVVNFKILTVNIVFLLSAILILLFSSSSLAPLEPRGLIMIFNGLLIMLIVVTCIKTGMHMGLNK
tara:strand:- start:769 stop:1128 length:360 start_codon:yes stop_codon:yes gene_type:complete